MIAIRGMLGVLLVAVLTVTPELAMAQPGQPGAPPEGREHLERRVHERFDALIRTELAIDEATSVRLRETMMSFLPERRRLGARHAALRARMRELDSILPAAEATAMLRELVAVQEEEVALFASEQEAILGFLSPGQLLRFYALRDQFEERVRRLRSEDGGGARRGGGVGGGGGP